MKPVKRCAIYTRKSTEEGLDQEFNSLDAQRESCEAYIASQKSQGWKLVKTRYDDGGLSGGNMERPALKALLTDIDDGRVDLIVVYKVDRLTRSLADFAKLVEKFDEQDVSFVSVTQQFNTSSSMGRLTLNVLLSFAQFEREVTAERIRDKIAASRKKGIWTGGIPPLGYDNVDRKLVLNAPEAKVVRQIYSLYLGTGCVRSIISIANERGWVTKRRANGKGGRPFTRGTIYHILANAIYAGLMRQGDDLYDGRHRAIITREIWDAVQAKTQARRQWQGAIKNQTSPLAGKLFAEGHHLTPTHTLKKGRRYHYYISHAKNLGAAPIQDRWRLRAQDVEGCILTAVQDWLISPEAIKEIMTPGPDAGRMRTIEETLHQLGARLSSMHPHAALKMLAPAIRRIDITSSEIAIAVRSKVMIDSKDLAAALVEECSIKTPVQLKRRGCELRLILGDLELPTIPRVPLVQMIRRAHRWRQEWLCNNDQEITAIAQKDGVEQSSASKLIRLAYLAPDIVEAIIKGRAPIDLTADRLRRLPSLPIDWNEQRKLLGFV